MLEIWPYRWWVLQVLAGADDEWLSRAEIAELASMKVPTVTTALVWAYSEGLVNKKRGRGKRGRALFRLTGDGKRLWLGIGEWVKPAYGSGGIEVDEAGNRVNDPAEPGSEEAELEREGAF